MQPAMHPAQARASPCNQDRQGQAHVASVEQVHMARQCWLNNASTCGKHRTAQTVQRQKSPCSTYHGMVNIDFHFTRGRRPCRQYTQPVPAAKKRSFLPILLLLTDLAWIATYLASMGLNDWSFQNLKLNPMAGSSAEALTTLGAVDYDKVVNGHQWWRIVAAPFLCSGLCPAAYSLSTAYIHTYV